MKLILISGLAASKDGNGLLDIAIKSQMTFSYFEHDKEIKLPDDDELYGVGFSLGGARLLSLIRSIYPRKFKYAALIEPVTPDWFPFNFGAPGKNFKIPDNVEYADCFKRKWSPIDLFPWFSPPSSKILNPSENYKNYLDMPCGHPNAPRLPQIQAQVLSSLSKYR